MHLQHPRGRRLGLLFGQPADISLRRSLVHGAELSVALWSRYLVREHSKLSISSEGSQLNAYYEAMTYEHIGLSVKLE